MSLEVAIQYANRKPWAPSRHLIALWVYAALDRRRHSGALTVRVVGARESHRLNHAYRKSDKPTNVLSFFYDKQAGMNGAQVAAEEADMPGEFSAENNSAYLGDLVICAPVVAREAREQRKSREAHWAHLVVHGTLHLQGYDHERSKDAVRMERKEIAILKSLGYGNPYIVNKQ